MSQTDREINFKTWEESTFSPAVPLSKERCEDAWVNLCVGWDVDGTYWHPLRKVDPGHDDIVAFYTPFFDEYVGDLRIQEILDSRGITHVIELREGGSGETVMTSDLEIGYTGLEGYWTSEKYDWVIYSSHEDSTTIAGKWLVDGVKAVWPDWENNLYRSPFREDYA